MLFFIGSDKMLALEKIRECLCDELKSADINIFKEVVSTNTLLKEKGKREKEWCTIIASSQTGGRGRLGRSFYSPDDSGVYFSVLLKPDLEIEKSVLVTTAAAVAVTRALITLGCENPQIKWVNDIFVNDKKVCGILAESVINTETRKTDYVVLGVGVNLFQRKDGFPDELKNIAGAVFKNKSSDIREKFVAEFLNSFYDIYKGLGSSSFMDEYSRRCFVLGKEIEVISQNETRKAKAVSVNKNAHLEVEFSDGHTEFLSSGEISIKI